MKGAAHENSKLRSLHPLHVLGAEILDTRRFISEPLCRMRVLFSCPIFFRTVSPKTYFYFVVFRAI